MYCWAQDFSKSYDLSVNHQRYQSSKETIIANVTLTKKSDAITPLTLNSINKLKAITELESTKNSTQLLFHNERQLIILYDISMKKQKSAADAVRSI